ncbi:MAG: HAD hydrolase-like protein [Candidatus Thorarchaeota archaeon]|nr:HAD hydrolase-like protein [Candidatus Thorarchaeota archaeon]
MLKALIFDFDGLILDTESSLFEAWREIFDEYALEIHMEDIEVSPAVDFDEMADLTEGYSGRDISIVCREAAMEPIRDLQRTGRMDDEREILDIRPVSRDDFLSAIENIRPATPPEDVKRYIDWAEGS